MIQKIKEIRNRLLNFLLNWRIKISSIKILLTSYSQYVFRGASTNFIIEYVSKRSKYLSTSAPHLLEVSMTPCRGNMGTIHDF